MRRPYDHSWRRFRPQILERDSYRCQIGDTGCTGRATEVDHIVTLADGGPRLDPANCRAACKHCNSARAARRSTQVRLERAFEAGRRSMVEPDVAPSREW